MAGKSLDEIWRKMQDQRQAEIQKKLTQEKALYEQRERARQEYLKNIRMYEKVSTVPTSSSSAAGGGSIRRQQTPIDFVKIIAEHFVISWADVETDTWKIVVHNFRTNQLSGIIDTGLIFDNGNEWYLFDDQNAVSESGHSILFQNNNTLNYKIVFVNSNGQLLGIKDLDSQKDFQYTENAYIYLGELNGVSTVYHFDGANVRTHQFPDININDIEVDNGSEDDVTRDGSIIIEDINGAKYYIARPNGQLIDISDDMVGENNYRLDYGTDYIIRFDNDSNIKVISQDGQLKNTFDLTQYNIDYNDTYTLYGDNCAYALFITNLGYRLVVSYDGDSNQFVYFTFSNDFNYSLEADEINWYDPKPYRGKTLNFYQWSNSDGDNIGNLYTDLEYKWLPKGGTQFLTHSFGSATVSLIDGNGFFTNNRTFTLGENPITMFADPTGPIIVGFLTPDGFVTQSTGIQYASCSNVWGKPIGENTFAVFDVNWMSNRIWQIYGTNSIIEETITTESWAWGTDDDSVHRNGTLLIQDSGDASASNSFYWTSEIGLISAPVVSGEILNSVESGNRTGLSTEYQVLTRYVEGENFVQGFYLLSKSGLSDFVDCFPGLSPSSPYTLTTSKLNSELLTLYFTDSTNDYVRVQNYRIPTLELIDDWDPQETGTDITVRLFKNRCLIYREVGNSIYFRFVGSSGVKTLSIEQNDFNTESNDIYDNG
jgi:hypothetical protein